MPEAPTPTGIRPSWLVILTGAGTQAVIEILAPGHPLVRLAGLLLILVTLVCNAITTCSRYWVSWPATGLVVLTAAPVWLVHGWAATRTYGAESWVAGALAPVLVGAGTVFLRLVLGEERR